MTASQTHSAVRMTSGFQARGVTPARADRYDALTRLLHWLFAVFILYASVIGYSLHFIRDAGLHTQLANLNMSLATILIVLFPVRLVWRFLRPNPPPPKLRRRQLQVAHLVHNLLYLIIFCVLASGYLMTPNGYGFFGLFTIPTPFPKGQETEFAFMIHRISCAVLALLFTAHIAAVAKHCLSKKFDIIRRMI